MTRRMSDVIMYELNEVPWSIVDYYVDKRPNSEFAALVDDGQCLTTIHGGTEELQPWRTWPTFHTSMYDHDSFDLGQDPATFRGDPIWNVAEKAGLSVGLFGPLQSWPPRPPAHGGFYIPDTFSQDCQTFPPSLRNFQEFNLTMTRQNGFSSDSPLDPRMLLAAGVDMVRHGLTTRSAGKLAGHLARERIDRRHKSFRPVLQVLPSFDLYWRLHGKHQPRLSIFFTNHVAAMMHRYWGDAMPDYAASHSYVTDKVHNGFILRAMDLADRQLGRIRSYLASHPGTILIVAASMGQGPVDCRFTDQGLFVLEDHVRLGSQLGLQPAERGLTMFPMLSLIFADEAQAQAAVAPLESVITASGNSMFNKLRVEGRTVTFATQIADEDASTQLHFRALGLTALLPRFQPTSGWHFARGSEATTLPTTSRKECYWHSGLVCCGIPRAGRSTFSMSLHQSWRMCSVSNLGR